MLEVLSLPPLTYSDRDYLHSWLHAVSFSRAVTNFSRDFSDGGEQHTVLVAEAVSHYLPEAVDLNNYRRVSALARKRDNWRTLNRKVFARMGFEVDTQDVETVIKGRTDVIERLLFAIQGKISEFSVTHKPVLSVRKQSLPLLSMRRTESTFPNSQIQNDYAQLKERDKTIGELSNVIDVTETQRLAEKTKELEQLVKLKDAKIEVLRKKLQGVLHRRKLFY